MEIVQELKGKYFFIFGYGKPSKLLYFHYNEKDDIFSIAESYHDPIKDKYQIVGDSVKFNEFTVSKVGQDYMILVHENKKSYYLVPDFDI